ncbi:MAG TPA: hypothetical protein VK860_15890 [Ilumatobacteraceae bacterium]|nr:hypothetical protein [Ilumatobacteraceae bacterium]
MLRASAHATGEPVDLRAITDRAPDAQLRAGPELLGFATALIRDDDRLDEQRALLATAAGTHAMVRASAVTGNFQMMNRLVDATGVPVGGSMRSIGADLGLE